MNNIQELRENILYVILKLDENVKCQLLLQCILLTTHGTIEFLEIVIRRTGQPIAVSFNKVEMTSRNVILAPRNRFHSHVHAFIHGASIAHMLRYNVAVVLSGPPTGTCGFSRDHDDCVFSRNVAYGTWSIVSTRALCLLDTGGCSYSVPYT